MRITNKMIYDKLISIEEVLKDSKLVEMNIGRKCRHCGYWKQKEDDENSGSCKFYTDKEIQELGVNRPHITSKWYGCKYFILKEEI